MLSSSLTLMAPSAQAGALRLGAGLLLAVIATVSAELLAAPP
jgi:hypothetical protein